MRVPYKSMSRQELLELKGKLEKEYDRYKSKGLQLDMSRGKPSIKQLNLSMGMMDVFHQESDLQCEDGADCRNYGVIDGIPEAKRLVAAIAEVSPENLMIFGNSSLNVMYDRVASAYALGIMGHTPWCKLDEVKFLCPVPGYDRHFRITEAFGIKMINIPMTPEGPDMDQVEKYVNNDPAVKGIWCTPKYANPTGISYSDRTVKRFAALKPAAEDFRIFWDNAYAVHHLYEDRRDIILEIIEECRRAGHPDMVYKFTSTSKISFPGSGVAAIAASPANLEDIKKQVSVQTIGHDKLNQLRHVRFFRDRYGIEAQMRRHADILEPKFELVEETLENELGGLEIGEWTCPLGGYFISFDSLDGCAKEIIARCKAAGVKMTPAGATFPYGIDPRDRNIRIAPSYPPLEELRAAAKLFALCVKIVSAEKILDDQEKEFSKQS